ncbi:acetyl-CoA hydrolase/transferase family protein [Alkaliphilus pronyensis]|uniref:Acetyl-CoA hydrolase/transferase family protein n=2 Tax=Alkaliphilus pronyensis TaxID=1482732 RepID=A0A6I0F8J7_9FIRM|nr:acetyl-CoA hydrolase/transferase family protein [Alkaliphilus pronyensis]
MTERIQKKEYLNKIMTAMEAASLIKDGMTIATSGFTPAGYPKEVPKALAERIKREGTGLKINLFTGASVGDELDGELARAGAIKRRLPYQTQKDCRDKINCGEIDYIDMHLSHVSDFVRYGFLGKVDIAIIEAIAITEEGYIIPSTSLGNTPAFVENAEAVIIEVNTRHPKELQGMHDIYQPLKPPNRKPIPIISPKDRIGDTFIKVKPDKVKAIVLSDIPDSVKSFPSIDETSQQMADNLIGFLENEVKKGRLPENLLPLQSGVGSVANAVLGGLVKSKFCNLSIYSEVIQDSVLDLIDSGKVNIASGSSLTLSPKGMERFCNNIKEYKSKIILRPQEISNSPEVIRRLGVISMNTAIEVDIYGNVNSTNIMGTKMMNGIGGSGDFTRNAFISIFTTPSTAKAGSISSIVPLVSHCDHTEHDVQIIITEQGVADLRGLSPKEKAKAIIDNCVHSSYKDMLREYFNKQMNKCHISHRLDEALSWHYKFLQTGTMKNS